MPSPRLKLHFLRQSIISFSWCSIFICDLITNSGLERKLKKKNISHFLSRLEGCQMIMYQRKQPKYQNISAWLMENNYHFFRLNLHLACGRLKRSLLMYSSKGRCRLFDVFARRRKCSLFMTNVHFSLVVTDVCTNP